MRVFFVTVSATLLPLFVVIAVHVSVSTTDRAGEPGSGLAAELEHHRHRLELQEPAQPAATEPVSPEIPVDETDLEMQDVPLQEPYPKIDYSEYPQQIGDILRELSENCRGESEKTLALLIERLQQYEANPELGNALIGYSFPLFHALWSRAPYLRENARAVFNGAESPYVKRILLQAMILDNKDLDGYFADLEYDILDTAMTTGDAFLLVDCVANVCNRRNLEVNRAALDFALDLDPRSYDASQHPGIDGVLNCYAAMIQLYPEDERVREEMRQDLEHVTAFNDVNVYQFHRALELLGQAQHDELVTAILRQGTRAADTDIADYCRSRAGR